MIRIYEYNNSTNFKDFENFVFSSLSSQFFDIPNDKVTIRGTDYRISTINDEIQCEECETCSFDVIMKSYTGSKINTIRAVRMITGLGLRQAKEFVENLPQTLLSNVAFSEIDYAKNIFVNNNSDPCLDIIKLN